MSETDKNTYPKNTYPFHPRRRGVYPSEKLIIKEIDGSLESVIIFDINGIFNTLINKNPTQDFSDFPKIDKDQLHKALRVITENIVVVELNQQRNK